MVAGRLLEQFRISTAMHPYLLRLRLSGSDFDFGATPERAAAFTKSIGEMRRSLLQTRRVSAIAADRAILKTLEAAFDFQLADLRYRSLKTMEAQSDATLDQLIRNLRALVEAIARLPPTSKGQLNKRVFAQIDQAPFDSEAFVDIIETIAQANVATTSTASMALCADTDDDACKRPAAQVCTGRARDYPLAVAFGA